VVLLLGSSLLCGKEIVILILLGSMNLFDKDNFQNSAPGQWFYIRIYYRCRDRSL